jgi:hypothetical protein
MEWLLIIVLYGYREQTMNIHEVKSEELCNKIGLLLTTEMNKQPQTSYITWRGRYKCIQNK